MFDRVLVLAPHTDDGELGCGGAITRLVEEGKEVFYAAFSTADKSLRPEFPPGTLEKEMREATAILGVPPENLRVYPYEVRTFSYNRQGILEDLVALRRSIAPDLVFMPCVNDIHQDHRTMAEEAVRAFKKDTLLGYEQPWNNITFQTLSFITLEERHVEKKIEALRCYKTQEYRTYLSADFLRGLARTRGTQIEAPYAEAFEVVRFLYR